MKTISDVKLNFLVQELKKICFPAQKIQIVTELPEDAPDGTIFLLILEDESNGSSD
jgi:hypothetical protein